MIFVLEARFAANPLCATLSLAAILLHFEEEVDTPLFAESEINAAVTNIVILQDM